MTYRYRNITGKPWTLDQILYLRSRYGKINVEKLSAKVGHPVKSVYKKAADLGLAKKKGGNQ